MRFASRTFASVVEGRIGSTCGSAAQYIRACVERSYQLLPTMPLSDGVWPVPIEAWPGPVNVVA